MVKCWQSKGQSLVEVVVAVGAMSILLVSLLSLVSLSLRNSQLAKDRAQAVSLAQEGVELMRAFRDYNWSGFLALTGPTEYNLPSNWTVTTGLGEVCSQTKKINEYFEFWRCVRLMEIETNKEVEVIVKVYWQKGSQVREVEQITRLTVWQR